MRVILTSFPSHDLAGDIEHIEIHCVSKKVKENQPELAPGKRCHVNMTLITAMGNSPCYMETDLKGDAWYYFKVSAEQVDYVYDSEE